MVRDVFKKKGRTQGNKVVEEKRIRREKKKNESETEQQ